MKSLFPIVVIFLFFSFAEQKNSIAPVNEAHSVEIDKEFLLNYFKETSQNLQQEISNLSDEQLHYKISETDWSVSECLEHIVLTEKALFAMTEEVMQQPENPERRAEIKNSDQQLIQGMVDRSYKATASPELQPTGKYQNSQQALQDLDAQRAAIITFINNTPEEELRNHVSDSPMGPVDTYQTLLFLAAHTARHTEQIAEVKAHPEFPQS